jgi:hypothetical protein
MIQAIHELQDAGDVWKIERLDCREECEKIVTSAHPRLREELCGRNSK